MKALIIDRVSPVIVSGLKEYGVNVETVILPSRRELKHLLPKYNLLIMRVDPKMDKEMLDAAAGSIKMIAVCSAGTNHIDMEYAQKLGICVQNAPGCNYNAVAELTISKMLDLARMTVDANEEVQKQGIWNKYKYTGHELRGHILGIIGYGMIGKRVGELAQAFGMTTLAYDPYLTREECLARGTELLPDIDELLRRSDYISIHSPLSPETKGMLSTHEFEKIKPGAIIINCARGGIIDETAAVEALKSGKIGGLGLDVLSGELTGKGLSDNARLESPLFGMQNVLITPHIGGSAHEAYDAIGECIVEKVAEFYSLSKN
ncbi:hypothetical protein CE91St46_04500 [Eubacteriales bacterium]|nr:phosphoglycerate dehydrogenase [Faecalicatena sp. BF-R-105]GKH49339.1 hypothetical protein CE91St46_04500 [Eubacteriales bacterium]GKH61981.1 hypothetical protein CE91St47_04500 [Eubacteriales bacterium]